MKLRLDQTLIKRQRANAERERRLHALEHNNAANVCCPLYGIQRDIPVAKLAFELLGGENELSNVRNNVQIMLKFEHLQFVEQDENTRYNTLMITAFQNTNPEITELIVAADTSEYSHVLQLLAQRHNELLLLQQQCETQNSALTAANTELQRLDEAGALFISVAAHTLRNPLASVIGYMELLLEGSGDPLNADQRTMLLIALANVNRLSTTITKLLDLAGLELGHATMNAQPVDLHPLTEIIVAEGRPQCDKRKQHLMLHIQPGLPLVMCDAQRVTHILSNLLNNASTYTPIGGAITVDVARAEETSFVQISVCDTGFGIAPDQVPQLFASWLAPNSVACERADTSGLGLHITRRLVEMHGGRIWVESQLNLGSTFFVWLPTVGHMPGTIQAE